GVSVATETLAALAREHRNVAGVTDAIDSLEHFRQRVSTMKAVNPEFRVLSGLDIHIVSIMEMGGDGIIPATANVAPEPYIDLYKAWNRRELEGAHELLARFMPAMDMLRVPGSLLSIIKEAMTMRGVVNAGAPRQPALPLSAESRARLRDTLARSGLLPETSDT
ncbi:MAG TPA: dihydrodipicolinate synthase family protein, partial [Thermomicrobiales bacterium]|nr:dihydrodipicolinate synthase family protein [Thermomicrobiales bacterium]